MTDLTQRLPLELLAGILERASIPDVLSFKQVNRAFRDVILSSPLVQHKIELYAAGLEYNAAAGICLADSRNALVRYRSNLDSLRPAEKRTLEIVHTGYRYHVKSAGGVFAIIEESVRLITLGSASRGIPHREWEIPLPVTDIEDYCLYPGEDVIAFFEKQAVDNTQIKIHLRSLSDGERHPAALCPTIYYPWRDRWMCGIYSTSMTSSRIALLTSTRACGTRLLMIWDWKSAHLLFELAEEPYTLVEFIDDHRLLVILDRTRDNASSLVLIDTEKVVVGAPMRTTFQLPPTFYPCAYLLMERGMHEPSPAELLAPFYQDPTQRIAALSQIASRDFLVFRVGALLELLESHEGSEIGWDEWKYCVANPRIDQDRLNILQACVSGCRLICTVSMEPGKDACMKVFDLSIQGRASYLSEQVNAGLGVRDMTLSDARAEVLASDLFDDIYSGHDGIIFTYWLSDIGDGADEQNESRFALHIWTF